MHPKSEEKNKMLLVGFIFGLLQLPGWAASAGGCPSGGKQEDKQEPSGRIDEQMTHPKECEWGLYNSKNETYAMVVLNILRINCTGNVLNINDDDEFCDKEPSIYTFKREQCNINCNNCSSFGGWPFKIKFKPDRNQDGGFNLTYQLKPCAGTETSSSATTTTAFTSTTIVASPTTPSSGPRTSAPIWPNASLTRSVKSTLFTSTSRTNSASQAGPSSSTMDNPPSSVGMVAVFVPIVAVLFIIVIVLLAVMLIRRKKSAQSFHPPANVNENEAYESFDDQAGNEQEVIGQTGEAFGNLAYQTVLDSNGMGEYAEINDGAVYYSPVPEENGAQNDEKVVAPSSYEPVELNPAETQNGGNSTLMDNVLYGRSDPPAAEQRRHNYDEVPLENNAEDEGVHQEVDNVLYGQN